MKRLNVDDPQVWNKWRALYNELTDQEQFDFANECEERYPSQKHHHRENFDLLFKQQKEPFTVLEIGGWKGELAHYCISKYPVIAWVNADICSAAHAKSVMPESSIYAKIIPGTFRWFLNEPPEIVADICVSSHSIEHFSDADMADVVDYIAGIPIVMFEAPIQDAGDDWTDYGGTHILTMGWNGVNALMKAKGYSVEKVNDHCHLYRL